MHRLIYLVPKFYSMEPHIFIAMTLQYNLTLGMGDTSSSGCRGREVKNGAAIMKSVQKILRKLETNLP